PPPAARTPSPCLGISRPPSIARRGPCQGGPRGCTACRGRGGSGPGGVADLDAAAGRRGATAGQAPDAGCGRYRLAGDGSAGGWVAPCGLGRLSLLAVLKEALHECAAQVGVLLFKGHEDVGSLVRDRFGLPLVRFAAGVAERPKDPSEPPGDELPFVDL